MTTKASAKPRVNPVLAAAQSYVAAGLSLVPIALDGTKRPDHTLLPREMREDGRYHATWKPFQKELPTEKDLKKWFGGSTPAGIAVAAGAVSGNAECIDIDSVEMGQEYYDLVANENPDLFDKLVWIETPRGGLHIWYRCDVIAGNKELAFVPDPKTGELQKICETRGIGGYALVPGSPLNANPIGTPYKEICRKLVDIDRIAEQDRDYLLRLVMSFDRTPVPPFQPKAKPLNAASKADGDDDLTPAKDFERRGSWQDLLTQAEATLALGTWQDGKIARPGKEIGYSATLGYCKSQDGEPLLRVFSSSWTPLQAGKAYGKFQFFRLACCEGDGKEAMRVLRTLGYGGAARSPKAKRAEESEVMHAPPEAPSQSTAEAKPASGSDCPPWEPPISLEDSGTPPPEFPLWVLPKPLIGIVRDVAESVNDCAVDYPASFALAVLAGTIGGRFRLTVKHGYHEISNLYMCLVGLPGDGKSPSCSILKRPLIELQCQRRKAGNDEPAFLDDFTTASLATMLQKYPMGMLVHRDELAGWILSMDQFKTGSKGDDRQRFLSLNMGEPLRVDRRDPELPPIFVANPRLTVVGGIQPSVLDKLRSGESGSDDGFFDRLLFAYPADKGLKAENWKIAPKESIDLWGEALEAIRKADLKPGPNGALAPNELTLDVSARMAWEEWTKWVAAYQANESTPALMRGPAVKMRGYVARLALILHVADQAFCSKFVMEPLCGSTINRAVELGKYFLGMAEKVYRSSGRDTRIRPAQVILNWIKKHKKPCFSRAELWDSLRRNSLFSRPEDLGPALKILSVHRCIRWQQSADPRVGRPQTNVYEVNPELLTTNGEI